MPSLSDLADGANGHGRRGDNREGVRTADRPDVRDRERGALKQNADGTESMEQSELVSVVVALP